MIRSRCVAVTGDDWYQRRRKDEEGEFFRKVADQGPQKGVGGATRQGIYLFTANGKLLAFRNAGQAPEIMLQMLEKGLKQWDVLPESERKPAPETVKGFSKPDDRFAPILPENAIVLNQFTRLLTKKQDSGYAVSQETHQVAGKEIPALVQRDFVWIMENEWKSLIPANPETGQKLELPPSLLNKFLRYHFVDSTRGEPDFWKPSEVKEHQATMRIKSVTNDNLIITLHASARLKQANDSGRSFDLQWQGEMAWDRKARSWRRFDMLVVGEHTGEGTYTLGAKPGKTSLGIAFSLADPKENVIPPQAWKTMMYQEAHRK